MNEKIIATLNELIETSKEGERETPSLDAETLLGKAHRVLRHCVPDASLPDELSRVRALLDAHMFGRTRRGVRDDVVEVARQIDRELLRA